MTASPPLNGHKRPTMPVLGDWQPVAPEPVEEQRTPQPEPASPEPTAADVEVARAQAWAEAEERRVAAEAEKEERRIKAQAEADAIRTRAEEEARRLRLNNDKLERKAAEEQAASDARIAESNRKRDDANRARENARQQDEAEQVAAAVQDGKREKSAKSWRHAALGFAIACAIVALPVQLSAFYNPHAKWLLAAPVMLEGGAWVVLRGAAAAVDDHRPHWHYRLIAWSLAFVAAGVNLSHGISHFDLATAIGTAFASLAGPGVWDLHEHGRIRKRDGVLTRRERKAQRQQERAEAARKAADEKRRAAEKAAAEKAAEEAAAKLAADREQMFPKVWDHAIKLAADLGQTAVSEAIWAQAKLDVEGAKPGESAEVIRMRNAAQARVEAAREKRPVNGSSPQVASQMPGTRKTRVYNPPARRGVRTKGDTAKYAPGARRQASIAARNAAKKDQ